MKTLTQTRLWINKNWKNDPKVTRRGLKRGIDTDGYYGWQCKDLVNAYAKWHGKPFKAGNAESLWRLTQPGWTKHKTPKLGDVFVMRYYANGVNYGHTGIVRDVNSDGTFTSLDQNWNNPSLTVGSPPAIIKHNMVNIQGFLRTKTGGKMYKGKSAKYWYAKYQAERKKARGRGGLINKLKSLLRVK